MGLYTDEGYVDSSYTADAIYIDWSTKEIFIPKDEMLLIQSHPVEIRQLDITTFHNTLRDIEDSEQGIIYGYTHNYASATVVSGVSLAQVLEIVEPYTITFEDGLYNVNIVGGNSNISDRVNKNSVGINTANSAGLQDSSSLQAASFGGYVTIDKLYGTAGTTFPIGTAGTPVNNISDARVIMNNQNISILRIIRPTTLTTGDDVSDIIIEGSNPMTSVLNVESGANTSNLLVRNLYFTGTLDGGSILRDCVVGDVTYFNGYIEHCAFTSSTILVNGTAVILNCYAGATCLDAPNIDLTDATGMAIRDYHGNLQISNKFGAGTCQVQMDGILTINPTVQAGGLDIWGDAQIIDNSTGTFALNDQTTGSPQDIAEKIISNGVATKQDVFNASQI